MSLKLIKDADGDLPVILCCVDCGGTGEWMIALTDEKRPVVVCLDCGEEFELEYALQVLKGEPD